MKKLWIGALAGMAIMTTMAMATVYELKNSTAEVEQIQGLYIFTDSKPVKEFEYLGTVKTHLGGLGGEYHDTRNKLIKKAKDEYPSAHAIIYSSQTLGAEKADVIKFK